MEPLRPLFWGQGMLLQPQHFQQQELYNSARLHHVLRLLVPYCWGIHLLRISESRLQNFMVEIEQCEVITFDGSLLRFGADVHPGTARIEPRSFEHELGAGGKPLSVYLGLRRLRPGESNLRELSNGSDAKTDAVHRRYIIEPAEVSDLLAGGETVCQVQYLVHDAQILFDVASGRSQDYELVKIAEINRSADGKGGVLSRNYIPPCLTLSSSSVLETMLKEVRDLITAKGRELGEYKRPGGSGGGAGAELSARDIGHVLMVQTLNRYIPLLHHHLEAGGTHPFFMYAILRQLVGELSSFSGSTTVLGLRNGEQGLPPYQHGGLWPCFSVARERILQLLDELATTPVGDVQLKRDGEYFTADLESRFLTGDNRYYLAIRSDLSPSQLYRELQDTGKITSRDDMPKLQKSFLFGLKLEVLDSPPEELLMRAHYRYFLVDQRSDHWQKIRQQGNITLYSKTMAPDTEIRLLAVYGK